MTRMVLRGAVLVIGIAGGVVLLGRETLYAAGSHTARVKQELTATSAAPDAHGKARLTVRSSKRGKFSVMAKHLESDKPYDVIVNGVKVGVLQTSHGGSGRARFSTRPGTRDKLLGFDPRGKRVMVRDEGDGDDVLVGDMPDDEDVNETACCIAEDEDEGEVEVECEEMTPEECTAEGGTPIGVPGGTAASCLPNPCATTSPPGEEVVCCTNETHDDENEAECEEFATEAQCAERGGMVVEAASCHPNPCVVTPPANRTACCIAESDDEGEDEGETECEALSAETCTAAGGVIIGADTCEPDPCTAGGGGDGEDDGDDGGDDDGGDD